VELIDLSVLITHVIGFLIVLWILSKFAWGPALAFLDARRDKIAGEFDDIKRQREEAERLKAEYEAHLRNIESEARKRMQEAVSEGNAAAARIKERAQEERLQRLARAEEEVRLIEESAAEKLRKQTIGLALLAAEKAVHERLDDAKHRELMARFLDDLDRAGGEQGVN
jgi:F-type H+-transporting ATPase subunit b